MTQTLPLPYFNLSPSNDVLAYIRQFARSYKAQSQPLKIKKIHLTSRCKKRDGSVYHKY